MKYMKLIRKTVYLPTSQPNTILQVGTIDIKDYYKSFQKEKDVTEEEGYFFTSEQLNEYTKEVIRQALETAAENAEVDFESYDKEFVNKQSITNTFEEIFKSFKV